jgi:hypothetical protein
LEKNDIIYTSKNIVGTNDPKYMHSPNVHLSCKKCSMRIKHEGSILELAMPIVMDISKYLV